MLLQYLGYLEAKLYMLNHILEEILGALIYLGTIKILGVSKKKAIGRLVFITFCYDVTCTKLKNEE